MEPSNLLYICSDQHNRAMTGCYGHPLEVTPNLDALAARGTRFANAYTNSPICMPARAALATGRYVHQIRTWDNAHPYTGDTVSWHHRLRQQGFRVDSIGKLHFRGADGDDNGFTEEHYPLYRLGSGDVPACARGDMPKRTLRIDFDAAGPGDSSYLRYDRRNVERACSWISERPADESEQPWALFLGIGSPHTPFIAPPEFYRRFDPATVPLPPGWRQQDWPRHPGLDFLRDRLDMTDPFPEDVVRKANATYLGLCAFVDDQVGRVLAALEASGQADNTRVIYTTDHGESMGARGVVGKFTMYDESAAVPMLLAGPDVPQNHVCETPVSLIDTFPTALQCVGATPAPEDEDVPGDSLLEIAGAADTERTILSEYHALATRHAVYMLRDREHKYVHHHNDPPQLFAAADTGELDNLASDPAHAATVADMEARLCALLDPEQIDSEAKQDQRTYAEAHATEPVAWPPRSNGPNITYTTIPPHLDPALADDPATKEPGWRRTRDLPDDWTGE
ncbi:MAG TPA: sulfatase-like hydrolase/transferase [Candidatus Latescibacteria bacterium]|jgi:choline-sulfatase|nr:sulfatase-like hydrolase/transferase [Candidatus Latescibacterota bacterium]HJP33322.1 sulfatase-like hydrolase/transferase [Candidatus Latescibacterota bacterium]